MRGSPLIRAVIIIGSLLLMAIPVWKLTHKPNVVMDTASGVPSLQSKVRIKLDFAHPASGFQVVYLGKTIWEGRQTGEVEQKEFTLEFPKEGIDLELKVQWPPATPLTAVRASVTHGYDTSVKTAWGRGSLDEVLTFNGEQ